MLQIASLEHKHLSGIIVNRKTTHLASSSHFTRELSNERTHQFGSSINH